MKDAGKSGFGPYPTVYDKVVCAKGLHEFCARHELIIRDELGVGSYHRGHGLIGQFTPFFSKIVGLLSFGRIHSDYVDLTIVAGKPEQHFF